MAAQYCDAACDQFIAETEASVAAFKSSLTGATHPVVFSGNLLYAHGAVIGSFPLDVLLQYVEGLKAAGAQRIDLNPGVTSIDDPVAAAAYDALVAHIRELGLQLAINPTVIEGELGASPTFQDFQDAAMTNYPALAARYQPDNFVIVHEPTTQNARLGISATPRDWDGFIRSVAPLIQAASPHSRLGAGGFYIASENAYFQDFVTIPVLDFMTMDIYDDQNLPGFNSWIQIAHAATDPEHPNGKGVYIAETWAPRYLSFPLPPDWQTLPGGLDSIALVGACNAVFADMDAHWLQTMALYASVNQMEAVTAFDTPCFFGSGIAGQDKPFDPGFVFAAQQSIQGGQLTSTAQAYLGVKQQYGISQLTSVSSASYATLPSVFTPDCGTAANPCNARSVIAPDQLVSAFGVGLSTTTMLDGSFPTSLGGTTMTLVDSSNASYDVPLFFVASSQVNYYVPYNVKPGPATLTVKSGDGTVTTGTVLISQVMPGLYTANANGQGPPAAMAVIAHGDGSRSSQLTYSCSGGADCVPASISLASSDSLYIELYGTGIRHASSLSGVMATVNGQSAPVQYAGASAYTGEDQVNIQIPNSLFHTGTVNLTITVDGQASNTVILDLQ